MGTVTHKLSNKKQPNRANLANGANSANTTNRTTTTTMISQITLSCILAANLGTSLASVAIGAGTRNPGNVNECLDPDTGLNHTIGQPWSLPGVCGEAHCEVRGENIYISYAFCGSAHAEYPCYLSAETDLPMISQPTTRTSSVTTLTWMILTTVKITRLTGTHFLEFQMFLPPSKGRDGA